MIHPESLPEQNSSNNSNSPVFLTDEELEFYKNIKNQKWRLNNLYYIVDKHGKKIKFKPDDKLVCNVTYADKLWVLRCEYSMGEEKGVLSKLMLSKIEQEPEDLQLTFVVENQYKMVIFTIIDNNSIENKVLLTIDVPIDDLMIAEQTIHELSHGESDDEYYKLSIYVK
jgi:hypothetical protein